MDIKVIRTASIYGPYDNFDPLKSHVIPALIKKVLNKGTILKVWGDKNVVRDFVYIKDLVETILKIVQLNRINKPINFSSGKGTKIKELVNLILKVSENEKKIIYHNSNKSSASYRVLDNTAINKKIKKLVRTNLVDGIYKTISWYKRSNEIKKI